MRDSVSVRAFVTITAGSSDNQSRVAAIVTGEAARRIRRTSVCCTTGKLKYVGHSLKTVDLDLRFSWFVPDPFDHLSRTPTLSVIGVDGREVL